MSERTFRAGFLFCGLGAGARGFLDATAKLGRETARFENVGGVDNDPLSCADFEYLTGSKATLGDVSTMTPVQLRAAWGDEAPDVVFASPPCKGFSGLLSAKSASAPKYQALNQLVLQGMFLLCETWKEPPALLVIENVPRIRTRGAELLRKVRQLLAGYGYVFHEDTHDCGEIGGLAQHRRRFLLVARRPVALGSYVYRPPKRRVRACGEVLETLPMPEDAIAGDLHRLPRLSWVNWVRLALIPAGGDWRDLPTAAPGVSLEKTAAGSETFSGRPGLMGVGDWSEPAATVTGKMRVSGGNGTAAVADPRVERRSGSLGVTPWSAPAKTVVGESYPSNGASSVADPRLPPELVNPLKPGQEKRAVWARWDLRPWDSPARTVAGPGVNGGFGVADPRVQKVPWSESFGVIPWNKPAPCVRGATNIRTARGAVADPRIGLNQRANRFTDQYRVRGWKEPAGCVTGNTDVQEGAQIVADPRIALSKNQGRHWNKYAVGKWKAPAATVIGATRPGSGGPAVADPRLATALEFEGFKNCLRVRRWDQPVGTITASPSPSSGAAVVADPRLNCEPRAGVYGVISWEEAAATVTGTARVDNGRFAVADPRLPDGRHPIIVAEDGTWHRPLTTLELAVLQGLPWMVNGAPLKLAGRAIGKWRERIGNAVPVQAGAAIAESLLTALLAHALGTWSLSNEGIWVRDDGRTEDELLVEERVA